MSDAAKKKEERGRAVSETEVDIEEKNGYRCQFIQISGEGWASEG